MKARLFITMAALVASATLSRADIIGYNLADDGDGVITCTNYGLELVDTASYQMDIYGDHKIWGSGHIEGYFLTDTETDPMIGLSHWIDNDTAFAWGDYHIKVTMSKSFSFSAVAVANTGWTSTFTAPVAVGTNYVGYIDYVAVNPYLNPVSIGGTLGFSYSVSFIGSVYYFGEELTPTPVPEPGTFALMACGLAGLLVLRRRSAS
jgi:hypothetical protein